MLPDEGLVVTLVFDDGGKTVSLNLLGFDALSHVVDIVADGAGVVCRALGRAQAHAALCAGEFDGLVLLGQRVDRLTAHRALGRRAAALVKDHVVAAVRAGAAGQLVGADVDGVAAGTVDFLACKEAGFGLGVAPAIRAFDHKFRHDRFSPVILIFYFSMFGADSASAFS